MKRTFVIPGCIGMVSGRVMTDNPIKLTSINCVSALFRFDGSGVNRERIRVLSFHSIHGFVCPENTRFTSVNTTQRQGRNMAILIGKIDKIIYSGDNYTVANIRVSAKVNETAAYQGVLPLRKSQDTTLFGKWKKNKKYGRQFVVSRFEMVSGSVPMRRKARIDRLS